MKITRNKIMAALYISLIIGGTGKTYYDEAMAVSSMPVNSRCIVIDAGHGEC